MTPANPKAPDEGDCGADTRTKLPDGTFKPCSKRAGWGTNHVGTGRCKLHGGASPQAEVSGVVHLASREAAVMGAPLENLRPEEALLECIRIAGGEVRYASERISELDPDEAVGPVVTTRPLKWEKGAESPDDRVEEHGGPALHIWIEVRHRAMDRLVNYTKVAIAAGLEERRVRVAEQQGELMAQAIRGILAELGVADKPEAPAVVRKHLTMISGGAQQLAA